MKDNNKKYNPSKNWSIDKGDYRRDEDATWSYHQKQRRKGFTKTALWIVVYIIAVSVLTYAIIRII